jgi:hypothetical protein
VSACAPPYHERLFTGSVSHYFEPGFNLSFLIVKNCKAGSAAYVNRRRPNWISPTKN